MDAPPQTRPAGPPRAWVALFVAVCAGFAAAQVNLVLLALVLGSLLALRHGRPWLAGAGLGLAVAVKAFPLPVVVYFAARRQWAAVASTLLTAAAVLVLLPAPARGLDRNLRE